MSYFRILSTLLFITALIPLQSYANSTTESQLVEFVETFVKNNIDLPVEGKIEINVAAIDPRITISPCLTKLKANMPENHHARSVNVKVYCKDNTPWQLYIPVRISQKIPVVVTNNILAKGSVVDASNTQLEYINVHNIRGESINNIKMVSGGRLKRRLSKGAVVSPRNICLVCKGETVTIIAKSNDFMVKTIGIALSDGSKGEQVRVKNNKSGRKINARVEAVNKVVINL